MTTPEGKVKIGIHRVLNKFPSVYFFMPVQYGIGASGVDYHCVAMKCFPLNASEYERVGIAFFIEAKKPGGETTPRQEMFLRLRATEQGAKVFLIDGPVGLNELETWLRGIEENNERFRTTAKAK
jgi:hypothetical protein